MEKKNGKIAPVGHFFAIKIMSKLIFICFIWVLSLSGLSACQSRDSNSGSPDGSSVLFQDDFSNPSTGWVQLHASGGQANYADGVYQMRTYGANNNVLAVAGQRFGEARIEVDAIKVPGGRDNRFGLVCRAMDAGNLYVFLISSDGYYGIGKIIQNQPMLIGMDSLLPSEKIPQGSGVTHLRADCQGSRLSLYVNGQKIYEVQDTDLIAGGVGLMVGSYSQDGTEVLFDNFKVYAP